MIYIGTSGFSYEDWVGPYYPDSLDKREWLNFYAGEFRTCELNFSYYRIPNARTLARMADKTPDGFLFTLKAFRGMTHEREDSETSFPQFVEALKPLIEQDKFGCVLLQFPYSFHATPENLDYLRLCRQRLDDLLAVVEFRNAKWLSEETYALLRELDLGFCCVDEPRLKGLIPPVARVTAKVAYVRFHGRNAAKWWRHEHAWERYDYTYSAEELDEWVPKIHQLDERAEQTFVFANNHWRGQAVDTSRQLRALLEAYPY